MNRIVKITWNGTPIFLNYSMEVMFSVGDKFGNLANALEAVEKYGVWKGGWLAVRRILRCHPFHKQKSIEYDPVP